MSTLYTYLPHFNLEFHLNIIIIVFKNFVLSLTISMNAISPNVHIAKVGTINVFDKHNRNKLSCFQSCRTSEKYSINVLTYL